MGLTMIFEKFKFLALKSVLREHSGVSAVFVVVGTRNTFFVRSEKRTCTYLNKQQHHSLRTKYTPNKCVEERIYCTKTQVTS